MEEALFLTKFASQVVVVHRGGSLRASQFMQERAAANEKIHYVFNTTVAEIMGESTVEKVKLKSPFSVIPNLFRDLPENKEMLKRVQHDNQEIVWEMPVQGIFVAIGHIPNSKIFEGIELDEKGFIKVHNHYRTNVEGVFVAGDVHDFQYMQAVTAAGFGCASALEVERWLSLQSH